MQGHTNIAYNLDLITSEVIYYSRSLGGRGFLCLILGLCFPSSNSHFRPSNKFSIIHEFTHLEFDYPSKQDRQADIESGVFIPGKLAPIDTDAYFNPKTKEKTTFITIPRFQDGVPATLGTIVRNSNGYPIIKPYPSWEWYKNPQSCNKLRIVSVYRIMIDSCDRLWVMDGAQIGEKVACPPQIMAFDLKTNTLISKFELPANQWTENSTFVTPVVDIVNRKNRCENTFVYMADCTGYSIVVYDHKKRNSWIVKDETMIWNPNFQTYSIAGQSFQLQDGILGLALAPSVPVYGKRLFYHAMSSETEHWVKTSDLQNEQLFTSGRNSYSRIFYTYKGTRHTQSAAEAIDKDGVLYFGLMSNISVGCFDTDGEYGIPGDYSDVIAHNENTLQFISGMKVITDLSGEQYVQLLSSRFQKVATDTISPREINYRIQIASVKNLRLGTRCKPSQRPGPPVTHEPSYSTPTSNSYNNGGPVVFPSNDFGRLFCLALVLYILPKPTFSQKGMKKKFSIQYEFSYLEFDYSSRRDREAAIKSGEFIPGKLAPIDTDAYFNPKTNQKTTFITIPRFQDGVPATLGTVFKNSSGYPIIKPYPSWEWFKNPTSCNKQRIVSVYRIMVDSCERLWVMDGAQIGEKVACPPQIMAFDLKTNKLISTYELPQDQWTENSTFVTPIVDIVNRKNRCENTFVYMADCTGYSIVVYDHKKRISWIVKDETMKPDPDFETFSIAGQSFQLQDGILGLALAPSVPVYGKRLFYHALSSEIETWVRTSDLQNQQLFTDSQTSYSHIFYTYKGTRHTQSAAEAIDKDGVLYFGLMSNISVGCFNTRGEYGLPGNYSDVVARNEETLQFISGAKVIARFPDVEYLQIISSRFQKVATDTLNPAEINFRIQTACVRNLKVGTNCDRKYNGNKYY
ncbi:uncharacterized protein LOC130442945 [Diorhabda sublineata]|uniref:uncharacterized protein LOC130442945 n=1 Tax=Diorhabda sublineata TaxID=1163346 RepID=UPI0024E13474|nr:uncharacterized protein LOC130442945 [Diorhabda sublineata]